MTSNQAEQRHLERAEEAASEVIGVLDVGVSSRAFNRVKRILAAQFAEVERETHAEIDNALIDESIPDGEDKLRAIVRAGDALRESVRISYQSAYPQSHAGLPPVVGAWDAATEGIDREDVCQPKAKKT